MSIHFDTLKYSEKLQSVGVHAEQARAQVEILSEIIDENLATKQDIALVQRDIKELELRLITRLGGMIVIAIGVVATLVKLL